MGVVDGQVVREALALRGAEHLGAGHVDNAAQPVLAGGQHHVPGTEHVAGHDLLRPSNRVVRKRRHVHHRVTTVQTAGNGGKVADVQPVDPVEAHHVDTAPQKILGNHPAHMAAITRHHHTHTAPPETARRGDDVRPVDTSHRQGAGHLRELEPAAGLSRDGRPVPVLVVCPKVLGTWRTSSFRPCSRLLILLDRVDSVRGDEVVQVRVGDSDVLADLVDAERPSAMSRRTNRTPLVRTAGTGRRSQNVARTGHAILTFFAARWAQPVENAPSRPLPSAAAPSAQVEATRVCACRVLSTGERQRSRADPATRRDGGNHRRRGGDPRRRGGNVPLAAGEPLAKSSEHVVQLRRRG